MAKSSIQGAFATKALFQLAETAANTLSYDKLETGMSVYDKVGWIIARIEYRITATTWALFNGTGDNLTVALTSTNTLTAATLSDSNPAVYALRNFARIDIGTAASGLLQSGTYTDDYSTLPGGGLMVLPSPLYAGIVGSGLTGAASMNVLIYFTPMDLSDQDYFNLVQARQLLINS